MPRVTAQRERRGSRSGYGHIGRRLTEARMGQRRECPPYRQGCKPIKMSDCSGPTRSRSNDRAAEAGLVAIGVPIDRLARLAGIRDQLNRLDAARGDLRNERFEGFDEDGVDRPAGALSVLHDVQRAMLRELPDRLSRVRYERRLRAEQPLVPRLRCLIVADADPREED
jgi:hypothetical protein